MISIQTLRTLGTLSRQRWDFLDIEDAEGCNQPEDAPLLLLLLLSPLGPSSCVSRSVYMLIRPGYVYLQHQREEGRFSPTKREEKSNLQIAGLC